MRPITYLFVLLTILFLITACGGTDGGVTEEAPPSTTGVGVTNEATPTTDVVSTIVVTEEVEQTGEPEPLSQISNYIVYDVGSWDSDNITSTVEPIIAANEWPSLSQWVITETMGSVYTLTQDAVIVLYEIENVPDAVFVREQIYDEPDFESSGSNTFGEMYYLSHTLRDDCNEWFMEPDVLRTYSSRDELASTLHTDYEVDLFMAETVASAVPNYCYICPDCTGGCPGVLGPICIPGNDGQSIQGESALQCTTSCEVDYQSKDECREDANRPCADECCDEFPD